MKWMSMREFLRGGYNGITEPTVISKNGKPVFTVWPHGSTVTNTSSYFSSSVLDSNTTATSSTSKRDLPVTDET